MKINWTGGGQWKQLRVVKKKSQSENILIKTWPDMVNKEGDRFKIVIYCEIHSVVFHSSRPRGLPSPWNSPGQNTAVGSLSLLQGIFPNPEIEPRSPALQADFLLAEPQGKPKTTGGGNISLLQRIYPTQELNWGVLHCRRFFTNWALREARRHV